METKPGVSLVHDHLVAIRRFYENAPTESTPAGRFYRGLLAKYYRFLIPSGASVLEVGCGSGELLALLPDREVYGVDLSERQLARARERVPHGVFVHAAAEALTDEPTLRRTFDYIILSETINFAADVQLAFEQLHAVSSRRTRLILNFYSALWRPLLAAATRLGWKAAQPSANWLGRADVRNLLALASWELIKEQPRILLPLNMFGLEAVVNTYLAPLLPWLCLTVFQVARPAPRGTLPPQSVSIVVPARNESGNIRAAIERIPEMGASTEIIFVEGGSTDDTWEEILRVARENPWRRIRTLRESGQGKGSAVRLGLAEAQGEVVMILDADLTVPPEELPKFYQVLAGGRAEFANGVRLVYPMDDKAMRFLNMCGNELFSLAFSWILGQPIKDTLCGTKALFRSDYQRIAAGRAEFGEFDPFGDFDLLFGASKLSRRIVDVPIRYRARMYGASNIRRWVHGWLLVRMVAFGLRRLKFV